MKVCQLESPNKNNPTIPKRLDPAVTHLFSTGDDRDKKNYWSILVSVQLPVTRVVNRTGLGPKFRKISGLNWITVLSVQINESFFQRQVALAVLALQGRNIIIWLTKA